MWIPKGLRDLKKGVDSPMPTQVVSNEEFIPRRQTPKQKEVEHLIGQMGDERAKKLSLSRRTFMASSMGLATCFLASNKVYGKVWEVDEAETWEPAAYDEKWPKSEYFIVDVQAHFTNGFAIPGFRDAEFVKNMGFQLKNDAEAYGFKNFVKEMFFDSETSMVVISGVPGKENLRDKDGKVLEGAARTPVWEGASCRAGSCLKLANRSMKLPVRSEPSIRATSRRITTGTKSVTRSTRPRASNRWSASSRFTASARGNGTATLIRVSRATASSLTTTTRSGSSRSRASAG